MFFNNMKKYINKRDTEYKFDIKNMYVGKKYKVKSKDRNYGETTLIQKYYKVLIFGDITPKGCKNVFFVSIEDALKYKYEITLV